MSVEWVMPAFLRRCYGNARRIVLIYRFLSSAIVEKDYGEILIYLPNKNEKGIRIF